MSADPVFDDLLAEDPELRDRWSRHRPVRDLALALVGMRRKAGMSQKDLAVAAGWDPAYVSRLESGRGPMPEVSTVQRYTEACHGTAGYVFLDCTGSPAVVLITAEGKVSDMSREEALRKLAELEQHHGAASA
jgi:transcriptional regulator with XRE-family HTH domain